MEPLIGIVTVSDSRFAGANPDESGPALADALRESGFTRFNFKLVPDEVSQIQSAILSLCEDCDVVFTTGGTGFSPRDITPEATLPLIEKHAPGLAELLRLEGAKETRFAHLSRGIAGVRGSTLIVNLPGSPPGAASGVRALGPLLPHLLETLSGSTQASHGLPASPAERP